MTTIEEVIRNHNIRLDYDEDEVNALRFTISMLLEVVQQQEQRIQQLEN